MTDLSSQYQSASHNTGPVTPDRSPTWIRLSERVLGFKNFLVPDTTSFPKEITDSLAVRILRVSESVTHAKDHPLLPYARELVKWDETYNSAILDALQQKKKGYVKNLGLKGYQDLEDLVKMTPRTLDEGHKQLSLQFSLCRGCTAPRLFDERSRLADLYDYKAMKAGHKPHPL